MRTLSTAETACLAAGFWGSVCRPRILHSPSAPWTTYNDLTDYLDENWVREIEVREGVGSPINTATIRLASRIGQLSLSPLFEASKANRGIGSMAGAFYPSIDEARRLYLEAALVPMDGSPLTYHKVFDGYVDRWRFDGDEIELTCRDRAGLELADTMIEDERWYSGPELFTQNVQNGTENGSTDPFVVIDGAGILSSTAQAHVGSRSLRIITSGTVNGVRGGVRTGTVAASAATTYYGEVYLRADAATPTAEVRAYLKDSSGAAGAVVTATLSASEWTRFSLAITTAGGATTVELYVEEETADSAVTFYCDSFSLSLGVPLEELIAGPNPYAGTAAGSILGDNKATGYGPNDVTVALHVPSGSGWSPPSGDGNPISPLERTGVFEALQKLVKHIGWECRYRWDSSSGDYKLTLFQFARANTTPDITFSLADILSLPFERGLENVRNYVNAQWNNAGVLTTEVQNAAAASDIKYGRRYMFIPTGATAAIGTLPAAQTFVANVLSDLQYGRVEAQFEIPFRKNLEVGDLVRLPGDDIHWDAAINYDLGVQHLTHRWGESGAGGVTVVKAAGGKSGDVNVPKVTASQRGWLQIEAGRVAPARAVMMPSFVHVETYRVTSGQSISADTDTTVVMNAEKWDLGGAYNDATGVFTAPFAGVYLFDAGVTLAGILSGCTVECWLVASGGTRIDGQPAANNIYNDSGATQVRATVGGRITLASGETVLFRVRHDDDAARTTVVGAANSWFRGGCGRMGRKI